MSVSQSTSVATILRAHVTLEVESIDRMYLNVSVPQLQSTAGQVLGLCRALLFSPAIHQSYSLPLMPSLP